MRRKKTRTARLAAAAGLGALLVLANGGAVAEEADTGKQQKPNSSGKSTQGARSPVLLNADEVNYDDQLEVTIARGNVELSQSGRTVLADVISYNQRTDTVIASGNVSLIEDATGQTTFANYVELQDNMRDGFIRDIRILLADRSRLAGNTARRTDADRTEIRKGVYSPCDLCQDDPNKAPLWQLRAQKVIHHRDEQLVEYEDVDLDLWGVPVLWAPYFSHPDPTVKRQSGFLPATIGENATVLGAYAIIPYYWVLGQDKDLTITPIFTELQNSVLDGEYRQRFSNGVIDIQASVTDSDPNAGGSAGNHDDQLRGNVNASGLFDLNDNWRAGFQVQRVSDIAYLEEYKLGGYQNFLTTTAYAEDFNGRNYGSIYAYDFQSLQTDVNDRTQPIVLPVYNYTWAGRQAAWGRFTTNLDMIDIVRETGPTERRLSLGTEYDEPFTILWGQAFNFVAGVRADGYHVTSEPLVTNGPFYNGVTGRVFPQVGLEWRYPWALQSGSSTWVIEPKAAIYAAPIGGNPARIPNIDSVAVDFNDQDLFTRDRFVGYDQVDGGQRVDYGLHVSWKGTGGVVDGLVGQSNRFQQSSPFAVDGIGDGLDRMTSDYVGRINFTPSNYFTAGYRFRFDQHDLRPARQEVTTTFGPSDVKLTLEYRQLAYNLRDDETARQQAGAAVTVRINPYWSVSASGTHDLSGDSHLLNDGVYIRYADECTTVVASMTQNGEVIGNLRPGTTYMLQIILKNLGEIAAPAIESSSSSG